MKKWMLFMVLMLGLFMATIAGAAPTFTTLTMPNLNTDLSRLSDGGSYSTYFPGNHTWNGVPFTLATSGANEAWVGTETFKSLTIPVGIYGVTQAYTIINSSWGTDGTVVGSMEFFGKNGFYYNKELTEGVNVRDHYWNVSAYTDTINNIDAVNCFELGQSRVRLDMQIYTLPDAFASDTLQSIRFNYDGKGNPGGNPFLAAVTVASTPVPEPVSMLLFGTGLVGVGAYVRKKLKK